MSIKDRLRAIVKQGHRNQSELTEVMYQFADVLGDWADAKKPEPKSLAEELREVFCGSDSLCDWESLGELHRADWQRVADKAREIIENDKKTN